MSNVIIPVQMKHLWHECWPCVGHIYIRHLHHTYATVFIIISTVKLAKFHIVTVKLTEFNVASILLPDFIDK